MRLRRAPVFAVALVAAALAAAPASALTATFTVNSKAVLSKTHVAWLSGTVTCTDATGPANAYFEILMEQETAGGLADSATQASAACGPSPTRWSAPLGSFETAQFQKGLASAHVTLSACDDATCIFPPRLDATVRLKRGHVG